MGEKRGFTGKLEYDFNTAGVLEVCMNSTWYRTTAREFRSFDGPRRITEPIQQPGKDIKSYSDIKFKTYDYYGPVYLFATNTLVEKKDTYKFIKHTNERA